MFLSLSPSLPLSLKLWSGVPYTKGCWFSPQSEHTESMFLSHINVSLPLPPPLPLSPHLSSSLKSINVSSGEDKK